MATAAPPTCRPKVLIVGVDGATFSLVEPWAADGDLPAFARLLEAGCHGRLKSSIPPVTAPAWTSFMTGKNPGKHGLYHFIEPHPGGYDIRYTNARSRRTKTIWQILSEAGFTVGVVNVPMTYPPEPVSGYVISGMDAPEGATAITHPPELYQEIKGRFGKVSPQIRYLGFLKTDQRREVTLRALEEMDQHYLALIGYLMERMPVDVLMVVFTSVDTVQHFFWHYMDPAHPRFDSVGAARFGSAIREVYRRVDDIIGRLSAELADDAALVVMSDHGFGPTSGRIVQLNRFLADIGLLKLQSDRGSPYHPRALLHGAIRRVDGVARGALSPQQKARVARLFPGFRRKWERAFTGLSKIDWQETRAYSYEILTFPSGIWVNLKGLRPHGTVSPGAEYEALLSRITRELYRLTDPETGRRLITRVYRRDEIYHGPYLGHAPDLTLEWWEGTTFLGKPSEPERAGNGVVTSVVGQPVTAGEWSGAHALDGILLLGGAPFRQGTRLEGTQITDLAPTLLYLLGVPVPDDMDGRILTEAFRDDFLRAHGVATRSEGDHAGIQEATDGTYSEEESEKVMERLRSLGYVE